MSIVAAFGDRRLDADLAAILALSGNDISGRRTSPEAARSLKRFAPAFAAITTVLILVAFTATRTERQSQPALQASKHIERPTRIVRHTLPVPVAPIDGPAPARLATTSILSSGPTDTDSVTTTLSRVPDVARKALRVRKTMPSHPAIPRAFAVTTAPVPSDTALAPTVPAEPSLAPVANPGDHLKVELASTRVANAPPLPTSQKATSSSVRRARQDGVDAVRSLRRQ